MRDPIEELDDDSRARSSASTSIGHGDLATASPETPASAPERRAEEKCVGAHTWSNQFGDDYTPDYGTRCDCGRKQWGIPLPAPPQS